MQGRCDKHLFETAEGNCRHCGFEFCSDCLVYSFGTDKPPFCIPCAVTAAGIRSTAAHRPAFSRRELKRMHKQRRVQREKQGFNGPDDGTGAVSAPPPLKTPLSFEWAVGLESEPNTSFAGS